MRSLWGLISKLVGFSVFGPDCGVYVRAPVKLPGWSQPFVSGLQAWIVETANAKAIPRDMYMMAMDGLKVWVEDCSKVWNMSY